MDKESCGDDITTKCTKQNWLGGLWPPKINVSKEMIKLRDSLVRFNGDTAERESSLTKPGASKADVLYYPKRKTSMIDTSSSSYADEIILDGDSVKVFDKDFCGKLTLEPECISLEKLPIVNAGEKKTLSNKSLPLSSVDFMDVDSSAPSVGDFMAKKTAESPDINSETKTSDTSTGPTVTAKAVFVSSKPSNAVSPKAKTSLLPNFRTSNSPPTKNPVASVLDTSVSSQDKASPPPAGSVPPVLLFTDEKEKSSNDSSQPTSVNLLKVNFSSPSIGTFTVKKKADNPLSETRALETSNLPIVTEKTVSCEASTSVSPTGNISISLVARTSVSESTKNLVSPVIRTSGSFVVETSAPHASSVPSALNRTGISRKTNRDDVESDTSAKKRRKPVKISAPFSNTISNTNIFVYNGIGSIISNNPLIFSFPSVNRSAASYLTAPGISVLSSNNSATYSINRNDHALSNRHDRSSLSEKCKSFYYNQNFTFTNRTDMSFHYCQNLTISNCRNLSFFYCQSVSLSNCQNISVQYSQNVTLKDCSDISSIYCHIISFSKCIYYTYPYCKGVSLLD